MRRLGLRLFFAAVFAGGLWLAASSTAHASSAEESCFWSKLNGERTSRGIPALVSNGELVSIARRHSQRMADAGKIFHNSNLANEVSPGWKSLGENVGVGPTCDAIHTAFMNSASHRANVLDPEYNQGGVGVVVKDGAIYVTEIFMEKAFATATQTQTTTKTTTTKTTTTKPKAATAPPPPPPPPPGSKITGTSLAYLSFMEKEAIPSDETRAEYLDYLSKLAEERKERARLEAARIRSEHGFISRLASLVAAALSSTL